MKETPHNQSLVWTQRAAPHSSTVRLMIPQQDIEVFLKESVIYSGLLKILGALSLAFCCLIMLAAIIERSDSISDPSSLIWEFFIIILLIIILSCLIIRYSKFLAEKFDRLNKLALFLSISIFLAILSPYINGSINGYIIIPLYAITAFIVCFKLTLWSANRYKDSWINGILPFVFGLPSFFIFALFMGFTCRGVVGEGAVGVGLIILMGGVVVTLISITINVVYMLFR